MTSLRTVVVLAMVSACGGGVTTTQLKVTSPKPSDCNLDVYTSAAEVQRPYETVCMIDSRTSSMFTDTGLVREAVDAAKPEACKCGGDGIIVGAAGSQRSGDVGSGGAKIHVIQYTAGTPGQAAHIE